MSINLTLARRQLRLAALAALQGANLGATIDSPGDCVTQTENLPAILLRATRSNKDPILRGPPEYTTTISLEIEARASGSTATAAQDAIEVLDLAIEQALLTNYALTALVQQFTIDTETEITSNGRVHFGATKMMIRCEVFEAFDLVFDAPVAALVPLQPTPIQSF
jgi:hypothetical protein